MIIINIAVFLILSVFGNTEDAVFMLRHGAMYEPMVMQGHEYYRIFTSMFMHFGIDHLLNNMVLLGALGWNLELETGKVRFVVIYLLSGIGGNVLSLYHGMSAETYAVSAGASGAIFGLMGALLYVVIANKGRLGRLSGRGILFMVALSLYFGLTSSGVDNWAHIGGLMVALSLYFGLTSSGVDNWAHIGGLISGFILGAVLYRRPKPYSPYIRPEA